MKITELQPAGVLLIEPDVYGDERGFFMETYRQDKYHDAGMHCRFVQDNFSSSIQGSIRGLHFQIQYPQAKLVQAAYGEIYDVAIDIRPGSPSFGRYAGVSLSAKNRRQLFVPEGFAHGFCVLGETACVMYKCSDYYHPEDEMGILWNDPEIGIKWPVTSPIVSAKDSAHLPLSGLSAAQLPVLPGRKHENL